MRYGTKPAEYVETKDGERIGIALTSDFCSEHEQGLSGVHKKLQLKPDKIGYKARIVSTGLYTGQLIPKNKKDLYFYITTLEKEDRVKSYLDNMRPKYSNIQGPHTDGMWDKDNFLFYTDDAIFAKRLFERLATKGNSVLIGRRMLAFDNGTLFLTLKDSLDEATKKELERVDMKAVVTEKLAKQDKLKQIFDNKNQEWMKEYNSDSAPWQYFAISPRLTEENKVSYWLNPQHQQHNNFGWFTKEELLLWLESKGPVPKSQDHYKHLLMETKIKRSFCISHYNTKHYNNYDRKSNNPHWKDPKPVVIDAVKKGRLTKEAIKQIEISIKGLANEFPRFRKDYMGQLDSGESLSFRVLNEYLEDRSKGEVQRRSIYTHLSAYLDLGLINANGYSNTPEERTNINWWASLLDYELIAEAIFNSGVFTEEEVKWYLEFNKKLNNPKFK